jgi:hypothetical protein
VRSDNGKKAGKEEKKGKDINKPTESASESEKKKNPKA